MVKSEANQYLALGCETQNNRDFNTDRSIQEKESDIISYYFIDFYRNCNNFFVAYESQIFYQNR